MTAYVVLDTTAPSSSRGACDYSLLGFRTILPGSTVTGADEDPLFPFSNCLDYRDNTQYSPNISSGTVEIVFNQANATTIDYIGVAIHNGGDAAILAKLEHWNGTSYELLAEFASLGNDVPFIGAFDPIVSQRQRLTLTFASKFYLGALYIGESVRLDVPDVGFAPPRFNRLDKVIGFTTEGNQFNIGRIEGRGNQARGSIKFVSFDDDYHVWGLEYQRHIYNSFPVFFKWTQQIDDPIFGRQNMDNYRGPRYDSPGYGSFDFEINGYSKR